MNLQLLDTNKLSVVVANDLSGLLGTTEVVPNETNRVLTGDSYNEIQRGLPTVYRMKLVPLRQENLPI